MKTIMERVISELTDNKAEGDLILTTSKSLKMSVQNYLLSEYKVSSTQILGVRVIKDQKVGISYTESLDEDSLKTMIRQALENAETADENIYEQIQSLSGEVMDVQIPVQEDVKTEDKIKNVLELEAHPKRLDKRVQAVPYNGYSEHDVESHYLSSKGRYGLYTDQAYSIWSSVLLSEGDKKATYYDFHQAHRFGDLNWKKVVENSVSFAQQILQEQTIPTGQYQVMLTTDALSNLLGVFSRVFSAKATKDKVNPWGEKLGSVVASADITIEDHPLFPKTFRVSKFDDEGVERRPLKLVENGELRSFYHNSVTAHYFKTQTTGHGSRSATGTLGVDGTTLVITGKNAKPKPTRYLEIIQLDGLHAGTNAITGDFSLPVKGFVWENGEKVKTFGNVTLGGNFYEMLKNVEVGGEELIASTGQSFFSVPLIFNSLSIAGS